MFTDASWEHVNGEGDDALIFSDEDLLSLSMEDDQFSSKRAHNHMACIKEISMSPKSEIQCGKRGWKLKPEFSIESATLGYLELHAILVLEEDYDCIEKEMPMFPLGELLDRIKKPWLTPQLPKAIMNCNQRPYSAVFEGFQISEEAKKRDLRLVFTCVDQLQKVVHCMPTSAFHCSTRVIKDEGKLSEAKRRMAEINHQTAHTEHAMPGNVTVEGDLTVHGNLSANGVSVAGADYAEMFKLAEPSKPIEPHTVVGMDDDGLVSLDTHFAPSTLPSLWISSPPSRLEL